jgi:translation elongation factor EF-Tu-like GTPase
MFSNLFQKATLIGITALTSIAMNGSFMANSAQAATLDTLNSEAVTGNSSFNQSQTEGTKVISLKRGMVICKPGSVKPHSVSSCKRTDNNKPSKTTTASVTKPANERTNNNQPVSVNNPASNKK